MTQFTLTPGNFSYNKETKTISVSEKLVRFDTSYQVTNSTTEKSQVFNFSHSTGPEFDPKTQWIYKSEAGCLLAVCNDAEMTKVAAANYLAAKTR